MVSHMHILHCSNIVSKRANKGEWNEVIYVVIIWRTSYLISRPMNAIIEVVVYNTKPIEPDIPTTAICKLILSAWKGQQQIG